MRISYDSCASNANSYNAYKSYLEFDLLNLFTISPTKKSQKNYERSHLRKSEVLLKKNLNGKKTNNIKVSYQGPLEEHKQERLQ